jgi:tetratricopeptide (TPR) repeat protein
MAGLLFALLATYANHFHNAFHFDDFHTITHNPAIRSLANVPRFFTDGRTFSVLPAHYSYRPLISASLALDYWLGKSLDPLWFHISTFFWYVVQLGLMCLLYIRIMDRSRAASHNVYFAMFAVAWYALHPANAETVNYIIQRGDLYSTLGVIAGFVIYCYAPGTRKWGVYLLPVALGALAKPTALVFPALLFIYALLFEDRDEAATTIQFHSRDLRRAALACLPAVLACLALAVLDSALTPRTFVAGAASRAQYWLTQPIVALHYFKTFFLPTELTADTDRPLTANLFSETAVIGIAFLCAVLLAVRATLRTRELRPIAFGLLWFLIALLPTSLIPLAEPDNDHRMFFPFVGLALAATWTVRVVVEKRARWLSLPAWRATVVVCSLCLLAGYAYGTYQRNVVWHSEESLWLDVTEKSPHNGRGLMNYGLTLMAKGDIGAAYGYFQRAAAFTPNYSTLEINLGVAAGALHRDAEAEEHFRRAIALAPQDSQSYSFFGRWLRGQSRIPEAIAMLNRSSELNSIDLGPRYELMAIYSQQSDWVGLKRVTDEVLRIAPGDPQGRRYAAMAQTPPAARVVAGVQPAAPRIAAESYLSLSLVYCQTGRFEDCAHAAKEALRLRPNYAEAYNNIAAAYQSMGRWDEAMEAAQAALRLKPDFQLARNNLAYERAQKALRAGQEIAKAEKH